MRSNILTNTSRADLHVAYSSQVHSQLGTRVITGRIDIEQSATNLPQLITDLGHVIAEAARRKGLILNVSIDPDVPARVVLDGRHLRQILLNLLGNAVKFTAKGEVSLEIARHGDELTFAVADTGPGIAAEELSQIFDAFTQTRSGATAGGTGLGLTISRHLLQVMGSDLRVHSVAGEGSRFYFTLPLIAAGEDAALSDLSAPQPTLYARLAPGQQVTALVVDDSTVSRRILASLLESAGLQVITATGGLEGIDLARAHHPDVIFMDVRMADLDGFSATRRLVADDATKKIPVIAVTASAFGNTKEAALEAGCVEYLPKPVRAEALFAALNEHLGVQFVAETDEPAATDVMEYLPRHAVLAPHLREAAAIGAISDLHMIASTLAFGDPLDAALSRRISALASSFDFEGLRALAASLEGTAGTEGSDSGFTRGSGDAR